MSSYTYSPFNIRIESEQASFYRIPRTSFWNYVRQDQQLQEYVRDYYRKNLTEAIKTLQNMTMNGKKGAVCSFLIKASNIFGVYNKDVDGTLIDFPITNEDIAGFCGISTRNSVNRIIRDLKDEKLIRVQNKRILILNSEALADYTVG